MKHTTRKGAAALDSAAPRTVPSPWRLSLGALPLLAFGLAGCRADSLVTPSITECDNPQSCEAPVVEPEVTAQAGTSLSDARERMISGVADGDAGARLGAALQALSAEVAAQRTMQARIRLAEAYDLLDELEGSAPAGTIHPDAPEFAAIRLSLVPIARSLGVGLR